MSDDQQTQRRDEDAALQREIRRERKFSLEEAIAELAGGGGMKGASPVTGLEQAAVEIENWLKANLPDPGGALRSILHRSVKGSELLLKNFSQPLVVLADCCRRALASDYLLEELVRNCDIEWARTMDERPMFERPGTPADPADPYTIESVRSQLSTILRDLHDPSDTESRIPNPESRILNPES